MPDAILSLTPAAEAAISDLLSGHGAAGLRIAVTSGGCAGVRYALSLEAEARPGDAVIRRGGATVFVDCDSRPGLAGTVVDFVADAGGGFTFANPNAAGCRGCSCEGDCTP